MSDLNTRLVHPPVNRRTALQAGAIGLLGLGMNHVGLLRALAAENQKNTDPTGPNSLPTPRAKSVIYIFLSGGLAQHESFDMKPEAPLEIRGEFRPMATRTPGIQICEHLPELAKRSQLWALCRSLTHTSNDHSQGHHIMLTGRSEIPPGFDPTAPKPTDWPSLASTVRQAVPPRANLPPSLVLPEKLVHRTGRVIPGQFAGQMGSLRDPFFLEISKYNPISYGAYPDYLFHHREGKQNPAGFSLLAPHFSLPQGLSLERLQSRLVLRDHLESQQASLESAVDSQGLDRYRQMAVSLLSDPKTHEAFTIDQVQPKLLDKYGRNLFGWSLLLARQLVEAGVSLVQVNLGNNETWDTHEAAFPNLKNFLLPPMDRAVSALLDDLLERGMLENTLVVMAGEFGRTPKITTIPGASLPGRDHWGAVQTVFFAGGGVRGGNVVGASDKLGAYPERDPQRPEDLAATIYHALGIPRSLTWEDFSGRPHYIYHGHPIAGLFG